MVLSLIGWLCIKSRYPHIAVSGVLKSCEMLVTASRSSISPCSNCRLRRRSSRSSLLMAAARRVISLSCEDTEIRVLVSIELKTRSEKPSRISAMLLFKMYILMTAAISPQKSTAHIIHTNIISPTAYYFKSFFVKITAPARVNITITAPAQQASLNGRATAVPTVQIENI